MLQPRFKNRIKQKQTLSRLLVFMPKNNNSSNLKTLFLSVALSNFLLMSAGKYNYPLTHRMLCILLSFFLRGHTPSNVSDQNAHLFCRILSISSHRPLRRT